MTGERRNAIDQRPVGVFRLFVWIVAATATFLAANYAFNAYLMTVDKAPIRAHLKSAFASGDLSIINSRGNDTDMGVHQTNDCLIFDMAARDANGEPLYLFAGARTMAAAEKRPGNCELLRDWLNEDTSRHMWSVWYLRYIHGYRAVAIPLLESFSVVETRAVLKAASYAAILISIVTSLVFAGLRGRNLAKAATTNFTGYALISTALLCFFGLPYFGQSISHAPAIVTLAAFVTAWSALDFAGRLSQRTAMAAIIGFALFTVYFEYLTGYIPVGSCVIMALVAIGWAQREVSPWSVIRVLVYAQATFVITILMAFVLHTLATATVNRAGLEVVTMFIDQLSTRMATTAPAEVQGSVSETVREVHALTLSDVGANLLKQLGHLGPWSQLTALGVILVSLGVSLVAAYDMLFVRGEPTARLCAALAAGSFLPVLVWILAFQNHTTIHAAFMVRILVVVPMAGMLAVWAWCRVVAAQPRQVRRFMRPPESTLLPAATSQS
jgi:hypothetical protein